MTFLKWQTSVSIESTVSTSIRSSHAPRWHSLRLAGSPSAAWKPVSLLGRLRARSLRPFLLALPKSGELPLLTRLQNRACAFPFTRLLSDAAPVMSTIQLTGLGDALSALHTYLGQAGFMSYACLLVPLPSTPPLPRQRILGITPGLGFLGDPTSGPGVRLTTCSRGHPREPV